MVEKTFYSKAGRQQIGMAQTNKGKQLSLTLPFMLVTCVACKPGFAP